jgi:hypothetical protein
MSTHQRGARRVRHRSNWKGKTFCDFGIDTHASEQNVRPERTPEHGREERLSALHAHAEPTLMRLANLCFVDGGGTSASRAQCVGPRTKGREFVGGTLVTFVEFESGSAISGADPEREECHARGFRYPPRLSHRD